MKKSYVDWENRLIIGQSGTKYKILPEKISVGRWSKYELWSTLIAVRMDSDTFIKTINDILSSVEKAKDLTLGNVIYSFGKLRDLRDNIAKFSETGRSQLVEFAALFCLKSDKDGNIIEDVGDLSEDVIREKYEDWKYIDMSDFFLLVSRHIPQFQENYSFIQNKIKEDRQK